jgi:hypothetical protein
MKRFASLAAAALLLALAGWSGSTSIGSDTPTTILATTGSGPAAAMNEALLSGELTVTDGCVTINDASVPIFPNTAEWDGTVLTWSGTAYRVGDAISLTGGQLDSNKDLPSQCDSLAPFYVSGG